MKTERIPNTQATLFDNLASGQKLLFNGLPIKREKSVAGMTPSLLESISDDLDDMRKHSAPTAGQSRLF
jgi:hypothetical protein